MPTRRTRFHSVKGEVDSRNLKRSDELAQFCILQDKFSVLDTVLRYHRLMFTPTTAILYHLSENKTPTNRSCEATRRLSRVSELLNLKRHRE